MAILRAFAFFFLVMFLIVSPLCCMAKNILYSGESLGPEEDLAAGNFGLRMQGDCNLVLYHHSDPIWSTNTQNNGQKCRLSFLSNASLAIYDVNDNIVAGIDMNLEVGEYIFVLRDNGKIEIYGPQRYPKYESNGFFGIGYFVNKRIFDITDALPANKPKPARVAMVVNN